MQMYDINHLKTFKLQLNSVNNVNKFRMHIIVSYIQCQHLIPALNTGQPVHNTHPHARLTPSFLVLDALMCLDYF